jgi:hypothetical protein
MTLWMTSAFTSSFSSAREVGFSVNRWAGGIRREKVTENPFIVHRNESNASRALECGAARYHRSMNEYDWSGLINLLESAKRGLHFGEGLSDAEVRRAEENYRVRFPPDLRAFLQTALPLSFPFPNWRVADDPIARGAESVVFERRSFRCRE